MLNNLNLKTLLTDGNLLQAWEKVTGNNGSAGVDRQSCQDFEKNLWQNLNLLRDEVIYDTYRPKALLRIKIPKHNNTGIRSLSIPCVRDRILQTALTQLLTPIFETQFETISFAYRKGKSVKQAITAIEKLRDKGYKWVVDADIDSFFNNVDHALLTIEIKKLLKDEALLTLIQQWLTPTIVDNKQTYILNKGIPQGSPLSPLLANLFLDTLDDYLLKNNLHLIRYADDFVILCKDQDKAKKALELTTDILKQLKLTFNTKKTHIASFDEGFHFLGVDFIHTFTSRHKNKTLKDTVKKNIKQNVFDLTHTEINTVEEIEFLEAEIVTLDNALKENTHYQLDPILQTLFIQQHGAILSKEHERFVIILQDKTKQTVPAIHVHQIMLFGNVQLTTQVMQFCLQQRIPVYLLSNAGKYYGAIDSFDTKSVKLHQQQFISVSNQGFSLNIVKNTIYAKIKNTQTLLKRLARHKNRPAFIQATNEMKSMLNKITYCTSKESLLGCEGNAAKIYFSALKQTLDKKWSFSKRIKHPSTDPINAMLSYGYSLLFFNVYSLLKLQGLNPHIGYLHAIRMGHPALVSDMMEEFRAIIVDSVVLNLTLNNRLTPNEFYYKDNQCFLNEKARKIFIKELEKKMNTRIIHPHSGLKLDYRRCIAHQLQHLKNCILKSDSSYQAMIVK